MSVVLLVTNLLTCNFSLCIVGYCTSHIRVQGTDKSLARPGRKQATATEDFEFHISYL